MTTAKDVLKKIKDNDVKYVDFRFTDPRGKWQHVTFDVTMIEEETFAEGVMFDGSSIAGWKAIHESDMCLMPDPASAHVNVTVALPSMVPSGLGAGVTRAVIVGFVLSMLTVTDALFVLPARSVAATARS